MCKKRHSAIKVRIISGLFALSAFNYGTAQAAATVSAPTTTAVSAAFSIDTTATDFYIFGDNVQKSGGTVFGDVTGTSEVATNSLYSVAWSGGAPTASSTGSTKYDVCALGSSYSPKATSCSFALKMPSSTATLDVWLRPNGNTGTLTYDVTVGGVKNSYSDASGIKRLTYSITNATVGETITFQVHNVVGSNGWHNIGFQAAQLKTPKTDQTISFSPALTGTVGQTANLTATASSGLATTLASSPSTVCKVTGNSVAFAAVGDCKVTANQAGDATYNAATEVSANIVVSNAPKTNQTITFSSLAAKVFGDADFNVSATATSNLPVTLSATGSCSLTSSMVKITGAGDCSIKASQAGDTTYNAATDVTQTFAISKANQIITFTPALTGTASQTTTLSATGGLSNSAIVFASSTPTICTVTGNSVAFVAVGTCTVTANQAGNANYNAATQVSANIVVSNAPKTDQTISFSPALTGTVGTNATLSATATSGLTAITFASSPSTVCTISGNSVSFVNAGNCIVTANQVGNDKFNAAKEVSANIVVSNAPKTDQTISFSPALTGMIGTTVDLSATATSGLTAITFASSPSTVCTMSGNVVSFVSAGNCIVTANQVGNDKFNAAKEVSATIVVSATEIVKKDQVVTFTSELTALAGETAILSATVDSGLTPISFSSYPVEICEIAGENVTYKAEGTCSVVAKQAGNEQFNPVEQKVEISVMSKGVFSLNFADAKDNPVFQAVEGEYLKIGLTFKANTTDVGKTAKFYLKATAGNTALMLTDKGFLPATDPLQTFTSVTLPAEQISLPLYTGVLPVGKYSVYAAYQTADSKEEATSVFTVKGKQTLTATNFPTSVIVGEKVALTLTGGASNNPIVLTSTTADICTVQDKTVTFIAEGYCELQATQDGNESLMNGIATGFISVKSAGVISLSVTDKDGEAIAEAMDVDTLNIGLTLKALTDDIGKTATFYLTAKKEGETKLMFANGKWVTVTNPLQAAASSVLPKDAIALPLYSGTLGAGKYTVYAKYQIGDKVVEATSVLNVVSKVYADAYAATKAAGYPETYATAYAATKAAGQSDHYATAYVTAIATGRTDRYATFYATARDGGRSVVYATAYATARNGGRSVVYATAYARQREAGKSEAYATAYATAEGAGKSEAYATAYATVKGAGKSESYATAYAQAIASGKSEIEARMAAQGK
jgi:hypothetical protein